MNDNNVGGASIIFNRFQEKNKTFIRKTEMKRKNSEPKPRKKAVGYDAKLSLGYYAKYANGTEHQDIRRWVQENI